MVIHDALKVLRRTLKTSPVLINPEMNSRSYDCLTYYGNDSLRGELSEVTRVLYCQESRFIVVKNDYGKALESTLLSCAQI